MTADEAVAVIKHWASFTEEGSAERLAVDVLDDVVDAAVVVVRRAPRLAARYATPQAMLKFALDGDGR